MNKILLLVLVTIGYTTIAQPIAYPFRKANKWGFVNSDKKWLIPAEHDSIANYNSHYRIYSGKIINGVVSTAGKLVLPTAFIGTFGNPDSGIVIGNKGGYQTMYDGNGKLMKQIPQSLGFTSMIGNYLLCESEAENNKYILVDTAFNRITKKAYSSIDYAQYGQCFIVEEKSGFGIIDTKGNEILPCNSSKIVEADDVLVFENHKTRKYGLVDFSGNIICTISCPKDYEMQYLGNGIWQRDNRNGGDYQLYKNDGTRLNKTDYYFVSSMRDKLLLCERNKQYFLVDNTGSETLIPGYKTDVDKLQLLSNGKLRVRTKSGQQYVIDHKGKRISKTDFFEILVFDYDQWSDCYIVVTADKDYNFKYGIYNFALDKWIAQPVYSKLDYEYMNQQLFFMAYNGKRKLGVIDQLGNTYWED